MAHKNIKTVAGCLTRVTCDITAPEGVNTTLTAFLVYEGESRPATLESADVIIFPAVPYGHYAYEIRCGGKPVAFGHLLVRPSAFPHTDGMVDYTLAADLSTADAARVEINIAPGPRGPKGDTGASAYDIATEHGYAGSEADWVAELQGAQAAASAAKASEQAAATSATSAASAASTLNAAAKKTENNTFTGTNTFNGVLVANLGVKVNSVEPAFNSVLPSNAMSTIGLLNESLIKEIDVKGSLVSTTGTFSDSLELSGGTAAAPAVMQKKYTNRSFHNGYKSYADYYSLVLPIEPDNCNLRVMLAMNYTNNAYTVQYSDITKPFFSWEKPVKNNSHFHVFEVYVTYQSGQQSIHCTTRWREGDNVLGVREFGCRLNNSELGGNYSGITHLFFMRESNGLGLYVLFSDSQIRFMRVGHFDYKNGLYSSTELKTLLVGATGRVKLKNMKMTAAISGYGYPNFPYPLSSTYGAYENLLTFEEYKQKYGITDAT